MKRELIECGQIVNTFGIHGEVKMVSWADTPEYICEFSRLYIDGIPKKVCSSHVHKGCVIVCFDGINTVNQAMLLKDKIVYINREDAHLSEGSYFLADIIGLDVLDQNGERLGVLSDILFPSKQWVYVVSGPREILIPAVPEFILETNVEGGYIKVHLIEGM